ncbi:MAG: UDP-N-acetylmuramoyl-L-alanine--D-glutamate ligase [Bdellovibrionales bacterium CG12_big_fil_rev_8_21_14_0_65_38_15]|nr:MAG: UDP-N-acetylmuramoyl-L-alanine--D-glutamate ligase [Bdellovibrionales bacterium CG22_combo_CG10-13_8_21_14_all_38_13]PIQ56881.1 MAG: UDP-N-acetylmuramoyl-L-alanine--D-glutamate ligase [Bdellovibrionales bacterium CG12_big_fil_rev_8_21_14_0_65_38_15]PIR30046.1 MAG: UDP-N-acetylmuramoyl-L-alanine--D-glutamate ligase [Bdellovibrionales bacterium CG11_big_fil_rev_8_21_14_0_20_38_13]
MKGIDFASLDSLRGAKIGIFGLGVSGRSAFKLAQVLGCEICVVNQSKEHLEGNHTFYEQSDAGASNALAECDLILLSPGIPRDHQVLLQANQEGTPIWNEIELSFRLLSRAFTSTKWLAITGTNGKTTTVTMVAQMLESDGRPYFVGGNIGTPLSDLAVKFVEGRFSDESFPKTIILELSSFQLESLDQFRPHACAILNISPSHGERYQKIRYYAQAKANIVNRLGAGDLFLSLENDTWTEKVVKKGAWFWERIDPDSLHFDDLLISQFKPFGHHNLVNLAFATRLAQAAAVEATAIQNVIDSFEGVHHRLEKIFESESSLILNDSKSTNWASTLMAIKSVRSDEKWSTKKITLVVGGKCRGENDLPDTDTIDRLKHYKIELILFGEFAQKFNEPMTELFTDLSVAEDFDLILESWDGKGVLLFSPAFPSFDSFKSYSERGDRFKNLVNAR